MLKFKNESEYNIFCGKKENRKAVVHSSRDSALYKNDKESSKDEAYHLAIQTIRDLEGIVNTPLFGGDIATDIRVYGKTTADIDNVAKGVHDAMQGLVYENDRQIFDTRCRRNRY